MPIYEYFCGTCGNNFEELVPMNTNTPLPCPSCSSHDTIKKISAGSIGHSSRQTQSCGSSCPDSGSCCSGGMCSRFSHN